MGEIKDTIDGLLSDYHRVRIELERTEELLKDYKKALYMACDDLRREKCMGCGDTVVCEECAKYRDYFTRYLQKAREE